MEIPILTDLLIIFGLAVVVIWLCHHLRIPEIIGFLLTGMLVGPYGFGFVHAVHEVEVLAEIGIILLLFTIGIEFSFEKLLQIRKSVLLGGSLQVLLTFAATYFVSRALSLGAAQSIFLGFLVSLSSTAIVLKLIQERGEVDTPHGRTTLGILIFQDIIIVPMILITPLLAGQTGMLSHTLLLLLGKALFIILMVWLGAKWIVPKILYHIARTRNQEVFLLSVVVICLGIAWSTHLAGLSLALGAFLAGLIISESEYSHQALSNILPFRTVFTSVFFVTIGMLLDIEFFLQKPFSIIGIALSILTLKSIIAVLVTLILGFSLRTSILVGLALGQVGEFSFILSQTGLEFNLLAGNIYQTFLAFSIITMLLTPLFMALGPHLANILLKLPFPLSLKASIKAEEKPKHSDHLIIIGFGLVGRQVARAARIAQVPYLVIEMNPDTVKELKKQGEVICYGDATNTFILEQANITQARVVVIAINDPAATRRITEQTRKLNPHAHLIVRTRYLQEMEPLLKLGANEVIPEEFETSVEIFARVLAKYLIPREEIEALVSEIRANQYEMLRRLSPELTSLQDFTLHLPDVELSTLKLPENSAWIGKSLNEINVRKNFGVMVLAVRRNKHIITTFDASFVFSAHDVLYVFGPHQKITDLGKILQKSK